jgi:hypothetical protein
MKEDINFALVSLLLNKISLLQNLTGSVCNPIICRVSSYLNNAAKLIIEMILGLISVFYSPVIIQFYIDLVPQIM